MTLVLQLIDAFADGPFTGNPAGVVLLPEPRTDQWMQQVAMEMNQAETAFLQVRDDGFDLRWFTPAREVDLCGHATLASAHYLWDTGRLHHGARARFSTRSGWLSATSEPDGMITLDFPAIATEPGDAPSDLEAALGTRCREVLYGGADLVCVVDDARTVYQLTPDLDRVARWDRRGVIVTARSDRDGVDFVSRCFFPAYGIPEDPVTGSAHCALATYWAGVIGRTTLVGHQASARGGIVRCTLQDDRVLLSGRAVTTLRGELLV